MAVKKINAKAKEEVGVEVETPVVETTDVNVGEDTVVEETPEVEIAEVEVETPVNTDDVEVTNTEVASPKSNGNVKIRMRVDHKCCIAMERYDLKAGKTYTVPENVKRILNKAGLLSPL